MPWALALYAPPSVSSAAAAPDPDRDVGRLYVGCKDAVHAFDLAEGKRKGFPVAGDLTGIVTGLAVTDDGARLFAVTQRAVHVIDLHTGTSTALVSAVDTFRAGPVTSDWKTSGGFVCAMGCVIDKATRSLVICEAEANLIVRLRGVHV